MICLRQRADLSVNKLKIKVMTSRTIQRTFIKKLMTVCCCAIAAKYDRDCTLLTWLNKNLTLPVLLNINQTMP